VLANVFGPDGLIIIAVVVIVLLFGGSKLPELARGLGSASHEFKKGLSEGEESSKAADAAKVAEATRPRRRRRTQRFPRTRAAADRSRRRRQLTIGAAPTTVP